MFSYLFHHSLYSIVPLFGTQTKNSAFIDVLETEKRIERKPYP